MNNALLYVLTTNGILFLLSIIFWKFPPKKINNFYGYRTHRSMLNEDIWKFANTIFNNHLIIYAGISFIATLIFVYFSSAEISWQPMVLVLLSVAVSIIKTERVLNDNFTNAAFNPNVSAYNFGNTQTASLDHSMWLFRDFNFDDWMLFSAEYPNAFGAKGLVKGNIFTREGKLVASFAQEGLMRPKKSK